MAIISKEALKQSIIDNVKVLYKKTIDEASTEQVFQAVSYAVKDIIIDNWIKTHKAYEEKDVKYLCFHFTMDGKSYMDDLGKSMPIEEFF